MNHVKILFFQLSFFILLFPSFFLAQAPESMNYQAVIRDGSGELVSSQQVGLLIKILQGSATGSSVYEETYSPTTNAYGLVNLQLGTGTVQTGTFSSIDWGNGPYFVETAADVSGGTSYVTISTTQFMSVPYALYAKNAGLDSAAVQAMIDAGSASIPTFINPIEIINGTILDSLVNACSCNNPSYTVDVNSLIPEQTNIAIFYMYYNDYYGYNMGESLLELDITYGNSSIPIVNDNYDIYDQFASAEFGKTVQFFAPVSSGSIEFNFDQLYANRFSSQYRDFRLKIIGYYSGSSRYGSSSSSNSGSNAQTLIYTSDGF